VKQFACRLLGIASDGLKEHNLVFLYFKPGKLKGFEKEYHLLENQFKEFTESQVISSYCNKHHINLKLVYSIDGSMDDEFIPVVVYDKPYSTISENYGEQK